MIKVDLHVHSRFSKRPSQWILQKLGCAESFTEPERLYKVAKERGMSLVTITDHNTINGALEIAHLPDTFVSEEITTYFPEDNCKIHVLALRISEKQHEDIQKIRSDIFELSKYLFQEQIVHVVAHPLYAVNDRLTEDHFEKLLLLFRNFEMNGARNHTQSQCLEFILSRLEEKDIWQMADKHDIAPLYPTPWRKSLTGGSDDHSGLNIARTYTQIENAHDVESAMQGIMEGQTRVFGEPSTPHTLAHNLYSIAYQFYSSRFNLGKRTDKNVLLKFLDRSLTLREEEESGLISKLYYLWDYKKRPRFKANVSDNLLDLVQRETRKFVRQHPGIMNISRENAAPFPEMEKQWYEFVNQVSSQIISGFANHLLDHLSGANVFNIFQTIGSAGGLYTLLAPYFVAYSQFTRDIHFNRKVLDRFAKDDPAALAIGNNAEIRVAHFTDTFYDVNGVAHTLQQQVRMAIKNNKKLTVITCGTENGADGAAGIRNFAPNGVYELPEYPEQKIYYPPFLEMLSYCYDQGFTHIQSATPGPIGLAALAIANILKIPISGTYHTALPQYAQYLTGDDAIEELTWRYILWYYDQMQYIYVPSKSTGDELVEKGIRAEKIRLFPRGIDVQRFHPSKRNGFLKKNYGIDSEIKLLYVGRVSKEKNLPLLADAFKTLLQRSDNLHLIVVGDGPYLEEMKTVMKGTPCTFTGYLKGEALPQLYASSDLFVFPSTTDTFGNVVLEAQASGLPVIVTDQGGPQENLIPGETGLVIRGNDTADLTQAIQSFLDDPRRISEMSMAAREYMEERSFENAFIQTWKMFGEWEAAPSPKFFAHAV